jgi:hypothetical protein
MVGQVVKKNATIVVRAFQETGVIRSPDCDRKTALGKFTSLTPAYLLSQLCSIFKNNIAPVIATMPLRFGLVEGKGDEII